VRYAHRAAVDEESCSTAYLRRLGPRVVLASHEYRDQSVCWGRSWNEAKALTCMDTGGGLGATKRWRKNPGLLEFLKSIW